MVGAVSAIGGYISMPRYVQDSHGAAQANSITAKESFHSIQNTADKVQPAVEFAADSASNYSGTSELSNHAFSVDAVDSDSYAAELSARMRISPSQTEETETSAWTRQEQSVQEEEKLTQQEEKKAQQAQRLEAEQKAEEKREAYLEQLKEEKEARAERIETLKEAQAEETDGSKEESEQEEAEAGLELDHTSALLRNYQMTSFMHEMLSARAEGKDTSVYSAAMDAMLLNSRSRVHFVNPEEEAAEATMSHWPEAYRKQSGTAFAA